MIVLLGSLLSFNTIQANESLIEEPTPDTLVEIPDYETPTGFPANEDANMADDNVGYGNLVINKQLITHIWHTECDVMGNQAWVPDIDNPTGDRSREGHRLDHLICSKKRMPEGLMVELYLLVFTQTALILRKSALMT